MPIGRIAICLLLATGFFLKARGAEKFFDFGETAPGKVPAGFRATLTGKGKPSEWKVLLDDVPAELAPLTPNAPRSVKRAVVAQLSRDPADERFPHLIYEEERFNDFTLTTRFKTVAGVVEQMAGVVFRWQNESNYYVVRASSPGNNVRFYKFVDGVRSDPIGPSLPVPAETWHELAVRCEGNKIRVSLNGKSVMPELMDYSFAQGKIGFWTKSDAVSYFLDAKIDYTPIEILAKKMIQSAMGEYPRLLGLRLYGVDPGGHGLRVIASSDPKAVGEAASEVEKTVMDKGTMYYGKQEGKVLVTLPVRDRNGESVAALRVELKPFKGQTEQNAMVRAMPIAKRMEAQIQTAKDLTE